MTIPKRVKKRWQGKSVHRYSREPLEHRFAKYWQLENEQPSGGGTLAYLMGDGYRLGATTARDELVANTVVQWLGSHVGQCFLNSVLHGAHTDDLDNTTRSLLKRNQPKKKKTAQLKAAMRRLEKSSEDVEIAVALIGALTRET